MTVREFLENNTEYMECTMYDHMGNVVSYFEGDNDSKYSATVLRVIPTDGGLTAIVWTNWEE